MMIMISLTVQILSISKKRSNYNKVHSIRVRRKILQDNATVNKTITRNQQKRVVIFPNLYFVNKLWRSISYRNNLRNTNNKTTRLNNATPQVKIQ